MLPPYLSISNSSLNRSRNGRKLVNRVWDSRKIGNLARTNWNWILWKMAIRLYRHFPINPFSCLLWTNCFQIAWPIKMDNVGISALSETFLKGNLILLFDSQLSSILTDCVQNWDLGPCKEASPLSFTIVEDGTDSFRLQNSLRHCAPRLPEPY